MLPIYVPSPELTQRQIDVAQKLYELRSEKHDKLTRVAEIDEATPALEAEWKDIQAQITLGLFGMVISYAPAPPAPPPEPVETEVDPDLVIPAPPSEPAPDAPAEPATGEVPPAA